MPKFINTFIGGLDRDTAPTSYSNKNYYNARNFSIVVAEDLSSATLTNDKGVTSVLTYEHVDGRSIVGFCEFSDSLILFIKCAGLVGEIHEIPYTTIHAGGVIDLSGLTYLAVTNDFNFGSRVEAIAREENTSIRKIYWVDGTNPLRYCNLLLGEAVLSAYDIVQFEIYQDIELVNPTYSNIIAGSLKAGVYQYAYCLYNQNGGQTIYSPLSQFIQVTETGLTSTSTAFNGSDIGTETTYGVEINIQDTNTGYDYMRVASLFYSTPTAVPEVTIIYEGGRTNNITISHTGSQLLGTLTAEEVVALPNILTPSTMASKYNYLFIGDLKEESFDVDFDARTYRFNSMGTARMYSSLSDPLANYQEFTSASYPSTETEYNLSPRNVVAWDNGPSGTYAAYKYQSNGTTYGGEGPNVKYTFNTKEIPYNDVVKTPTSMGIWRTSDGYANGLGGYANPYENAYVGYQRDEIYRFGIVFFNSRGQSSFVKWIGDIRMPYYTDDSNQYTLYTTTSGTYSNFKALGLKFTFDFSDLLVAYPDIVSYQIVRCERTYDDATVVDTGYVGHMQEDSNVLYWGGYSSASTASNNYPALHSTVGGTHASKDIIEYICPETNHNKNNSNPYDRLDFYLGVVSHIAKRTLVDTYAKDNVVLTSIRPTSNTSYHTSVGIEDSYLFRAQRSNTALYSLPASFGGVTVKTRSHIDASGSRGYKGTTLILKLDSTVDPFADHNPEYVLRRKESYPYGGFSLAILANNNYYPCSSVHAIDDTLDVPVWGGDTYISVFEYIRTHWADGTGTSWEDDRYMQVVQCLVESKLNLNYTVNPRWSSYDDDGFSTSILSDDLLYTAMWETAGTWAFYLNNNSGNTPQYFIQDFNMYTYNPVYSLTTGKKVFIPKPINFLEETSYPTRVWVSEKKINGELTDSWLQFLTNNYLDLDNQFGDLHKLYNHNNRLVYFQDKGFGVIPVEDREVISTSTGAAVSIGTGEVLKRYDYVSTNAGTSLPDSVVGTESNLYFIDNNLKKIAQWQAGGGVEYISDTKGLHSYMANADLTSVYSLYNPLTKEIHFSFPTESLTFNEYLDSFRMFSDTTFNYGVFNGGVQYILANNSGGGTEHVSINSLYTGAYGRYSSDHLVATLYPSTLDLIINPAKNLVGRFDIMELATEVFDNGVTNNLTTTFTSLRVRTNYQDTGVIPLVADSNVKRRFRTWRYNSLRDTSNDGRIVDNYARLSLSFTNDGTTKMLVNDVISTFTPLNLR